MLSGLFKKPKKHARPETSMPEEEILYRALRMIGKSSTSIHLTVSREMYKNLEEYIARTQGRISYLENDIVVGWFQIRADDAVDADPLHKITVTTAVDEQYQELLEWRDAIRSHVIAPMTGKAHGPTDVSEDDSVGDDPPEPTHGCSPE